MKFIIVGRKQIPKNDFKLPSGERETLGILPTPEKLKGGYRELSALGSL